MLSDLHRRGKLRLRVVSLRAGSVVVTLRLTVQDPEFPVGVSTLVPMLPPLLASTVFQIEPQGTRVQGRFPSTPRPGPATFFQVHVYCKMLIKCMNLSPYSAFLHGIRKPAHVPHLLALGGRGTPVPGELAPADGPERKVGRTQRTLEGTGTGG